MPWAFDGIWGGCTCSLSPKLTHARTLRGRGTSAIVLLPVQSSLQPTFHTLACHTA
ncbi:hypothetical protein QUB37_21140 [Microcoleus sp. AT3-A2]